jgi:hypothetical protein
MLRPVKAAEGGPRSHGRRWRANRRALRLGWAALLAAVLAPAAPAAPAAGAAAVSPADRAATHAFLAATYRLDQAIAADTGASKVSGKSVVAQIGHECPGVLSGAPQEELEPPLQGPPPPLTPRQEGEHALHRAQLATIQLEVDLALYRGWSAPDQAAQAAFAGAVRGLAWSDPRVAAAVAAMLAHEQEELTNAPAIAQVCLDSTAWAHSGFRILGPATKQFEAGARARQEALLQSASPERLMSRYEGPAEKALVQRTRALIRSSRGRILGLVSLLGEAGTALGLKQEVPGPVLPAAKTVATVRTSQGTFTISVPEPLPGEKTPSRCRLELSINFTRRSSSGVDFSGTNLCALGRERSETPSLSCGNGTIEIQDAVSGRARRVRLELSDGTSVTSPVVTIPKRLGGPARVYVQALKGPSPYPVSLTELDSSGRAFRTIHVPHAAPCRPEREPPRPRFVTLVRGSTPNGYAFEIAGVASPNFLGRSELSLTATVENPDQLYGVGIISGSLGSSEPPPSQAHAKIFAASIENEECPPDEYALIYGVLKRPGATVLARTPAGLVPLSEVKIPAHLHAGGPLAYGVFPTLPTELVVRDSSGATLFTESLARRIANHSEFCAGAAEPSA